MLINISYIDDVCLRISEFGHYQWFLSEVAIDWIVTNQIPKTMPRAALYMTSCGLSQMVLHSGGAHYDVTQAPWWPPCGVRRVIQKCSQLCKKINYVWNIFIWTLNVIIYHPKHTFVLHFLFLSKLCDIFLCITFWTFCLVLMRDRPCVSVVLGFYEELLIAWSINMFLLWRWPQLPTQC